MKFAKFLKFAKSAKGRKILIAAVGVLAGVFLLTVSFGFANSQKIAYGVKIDGVAVGGMKLPAAEEKLKTKSEEISKRKIIINIDNKKHETNFSDLGAEIDVERMLVRAFNVGRKNNFLANFFEQIGILFKGRNMDIVLRFDGEKFGNYLEEFKSYEKNYGDAFVYFDDETSDFFWKLAYDGKTIDRNKLMEDLEKYAQDKDGGKITISFLETRPRVSNEMARDGAEAAKELFADYEGLRLLYNGKSSFWPIDKKTIGSWIKSELDEEAKKLIIEFNYYAIADYLTAISQNINEEPIDAVLTYKDNKVQAFKLSRDGKRVNVENSARKIVEALIEKNKEVVLEMETAKSKISIDAIENLGITSLLATGVSDFAGSPKNRVHNIKIGAAKFNGLLLKPQEEFSFSDILGEVGPSEGYLLELVIKKDKTIPEYGGGLCQVSTTAFRAAILAGLEIKERYPHSFPVKYYSPQGFDAAVYPPSPDLKFVNDTPSNLLMQTKIVGTKLYFEFYGTDDGRKVVLTGPEEYDKKPDGSLKARLTREIFDRDGDLIRKTVFKSNYKSPDLYPVIRNPLE